MSAVAQRAIFDLHAQQHEGAPRCDADRLIGAARKRRQRQGVGIDDRDGAARHAQGREVVAGVAEIDATRAGKILAGYRGAKPGDRDALCRALVALGALVRDLGDIVESIDVNPFLVRSDGQGACALDALVVLRPPS